MGDAEEKRIDLEQHFILRLPPEPGAALKSAMQSENKSLRNKFRIKLESDMRHANVRLNDWNLKAKLFDLPSIVETYKTVDGKVLHKIADISQIMVCRENDQLVQTSDDECEEPILDKEGRDKRFLYHHGVTPGLKNVRKRRYRKPLRQKNSELSLVEKEVKMLLRTDEEAIKHCFKLVSEEEDKNISLKNESEENSNLHQYSGVGESDIFGSILSNSDNSDEEEDVNITSLDITVNNTEAGENSEMNESCNSIINFEFETAESQSSNISGAMAYELESEVAEKKLNQILQRTETNDRLLERLSMLGDEINLMQNQRDKQEQGIVNLDNEALKERFQRNIDAIKVEIEQKKKEYRDIQQMLP